MKYCQTWFLLCIAAFICIVEFDANAQTPGLAVKIPDSSDLQTLSREDTIRRLVRSPKRGFGGISFSVGNAQHREFQEQFDHSALGFSLFGGYYADPIPLAFAGNVDVLFLGGDDKYLNKYDTVLNIPVLRSRDTVESRSTIVPVTLSARFQPNIANRLFPYAEIIGGFMVYTSSLEVKSQSVGLSNQRESFSETEFIWQWGIGAGTQIKLVDFVELPFHHSTLSLDIRFRYLFGSETTFKRADIDQASGSSSSRFVDFKARADFATAQVGIVFGF